MRPVIQAEVNGKFPQPSLPAPLKRFSQAYSISQPRVIGVKIAREKARIVNKNVKHTVQGWLDMLVLPFLGGVQSTRQSEQPDGPGRAWTSIIPLVAK